jgi:hypothetical protein
MSEVPKSHTNSLDSTGEKALGTGEAIAKQEDNPTRLQRLRNWLIGAIAARETEKDTMSIMTLMREGRSRKKYTGPTIAKYVTIGVRGTPAGTLVNIPSVYPLSREQVEYAQQVSAEMQTPEYKAKERKHLEQLWAQDAAVRQARAQRAS